MAFESSGSGGFTRQASGGSGLVRGSSARAGSGAPATLAATYQGTEDSVWESVRRRVEDELRGFTQLTQQLERSVGLVGGARDSEEVRRRIAEGLSKGKASLHDIGVLLKSTLADAVAHGDAELSQKERTARKNQQQKFVKDWGAASTSFSETAKLWQEKSRQQPVPAKAAGGGGKKAYPSMGAASATATKAEEEASLRLQLVNFEEGLLEEREEAIGSIAQQISEVNETFRDLAQIVEEQGQGIDILEGNTSSAESSTKDGVGQLYEAEKHQKGYRKWILIMLLIIVVAAGGITAWQVIVHQKGGGGK